MNSDVGFVAVEADLPLDQIEIRYERLSFHRNVVLHFPKLVLAVQDLMVSHNLLKHALHYFVLLDVIQHLAFQIPVGKLEES